MELKKKREHKELVEKLKSDQINHHCADVSNINMGSKWHKKGRNIANFNCEQRVTGNVVGVKHKGIVHKQKRKSVSHYKKMTFPKKPKWHSCGGWSSMCSISW